MVAETRFLGIQGADFQGFDRAQGCPGRCWSLRRLEISVVRTRSTVLGPSQSGSHKACSSWSPRSQRQHCLSAFLPKVRLSGTRTKAPKMPGIHWRAAGIPRNLETQVSHEGHGVHGGPDWRSSPPRFWISATSGDALTLRARRQTDSVAAPCPPCENRTACAPAKNREIPPRPHHAWHFLVKTQLSHG
jgi:hypothetical protein